MANGNTTFGGGFARGLRGGFAIGSEIQGQQLRREELEAQRTARRQQFLDTKFQETLAITEKIGEIAASSPQAFADGSGLRALLDQATQTLGQLAGETGRDPTFADQVRQLIIERASVPQPFEAQSPAGKAIADLQALQQSGAPPEQIAAVTEQLRQDPNTQVVQTRDAQGNQVTLLIDSQTGKAVAELGRGPSVQFQPTELPATAQQKVAERGDLLQQGVELTDQALAAPEGTFGAVATVKRGLREAGRIGGELIGAGVPEEVAGPLQSLGEIGSQMFDEALSQGRIGPDVAAEFLRSDLTENQILETRLAFMVANALQPDGKLLKDSINSAREIVKLSGFTSEQTARERLATIRNILSRSQSGLQRSVPGAKTQDGEQPSAPRRMIFNPATGELEPAQ